MTVEILDKPEAMLSVLGRDRHAGPVAESRKNVFEFTYAGEPEQVSELLARLVSAGVPVVSFGRRKEGLEEVFLKVGARELS
jgi:ABC-2 type transport system ATP-binding protein